MENSRSQKIGTAEREADLRLKNLWEKFKAIFWLLFVFHLLLAGLSSIQTTDANYFNLFIISIALNLFVALAMVVNVGWYAYLFSKKKVYIFLGLLGLWWAGLVGIFVAYFAVQWAYYKSIRRKFSLREKLVVGALTLISLLFIFSFGSAIISAFSVFSNSEKTYNQKVKSEWVQVNSPDGELTMSFPSGYDFKEYNTPESIPGYSYLAYTNGDSGSIGYTMKFENYEKTFSDSNINYLSVDQRQNFLNQLAESLKNDLGSGLSNFSTRLGRIQEYNVIKFSGNLSKGTQQGKIEGYIVLVGNTAYTLSVLCNNGSVTEFDRLLESFALRSHPDLKFSNFLDSGTAKQ